MSALFTHEAEFWMWLRWQDAFVSDLEWRYQANCEAMTENYSTNFFPAIKTDAE